jgi:hypothetical protein
MKHLANYDSRKDNSFVLFLTKSIVRTKLFKHMYITQNKICSILYNNNMYNKEFYFHFLLRDCVL